MNLRLPPLLALLAAVALGMLAAGCGGDLLPDPTQSGSATQGRDYYPFAPQGYVIHWEPNSTITVEVPSCIGVTGCQPSFPQDVVDGIKAWAPVHSLLGLTVNTVSSSSSDDVRVIWDDGFGSSGYAVPSGVVGFAAIAQLPAAVSRFIVMTTQCNNCPGTPSHQDQELRTITTHEWGHMLGVWSHSFDPADVMYPLETGQTGLTNRDVQTMLKAYSLAPDLDLSSLPPNAWTKASAAAGSSAATSYLIRCLHTLDDAPPTTLEFNPPGG